MTTSELPDLKPQATTSIPLHMLTFHEVGESKKPVCDRRGYLMGGPDRKGGNRLNEKIVWDAWRNDVEINIHTVPEKVRDFFIRTRHLSSPPKEGVDIRVYGSNPPLQEAPLNLEIELTPGVDFTSPTAPKKLANPPRFATSFSGMEAFLNCPYAWAANKYFKTVPFEESEAIKWGNRVHKTAENYVLNALDGGSRPVEAECLVLVQKYCDLFLRSGAELHVEKEMCFAKDLKICGWKDWNTVWFRGKADLVAIKDRKLSVYDYKTGKLKTDTFQLEVMIAVADLYFGDQFDEANGKLIFVKEPDPKKALVGLDKPILKADIPKIWEKIFSITNRMEQAWETENFRRQTSGLCRQYCGAMDCVHNGRRGK